MRTLFVILVLSACSSSQPSPDPVIRNDRAFDRVTPRNISVPGTVMMRKHAYELSKPTR